MGVLFVSSEIYPFAKTGGLADVSHSLPEAMSEYTDTYSVMPLYRFVDRVKFGIEHTMSFEYWLHGTRHIFDIYRQASNPKMLFVYNPIICDRDTPYSGGWAAFTDDGFRFTLFGYGVLEMMIRMKLPVKVLHLNDWQAAPIAMLAKTRYKLGHKIILTIHNLAYQGVSDKNILSLLELDWETNFKPEILEFFDSANFLKAGIYYADEVTTVSPSYAHEIQTPAQGARLDLMLRNHTHKLHGILNGISYEIFDPAKDENLVKNYDANTLELKATNKKALLKEVGLEGIEKPLFCFIGRFAEQKGVDLLLHSLHLIKDFEANVIILGSGGEYYDHLFGTLGGKYPNIKTWIGYNESFARRIYAGSDFLLMPSVFEPCGLNQMIALRYGTMPIVAKVGGLRDTVADFTDHTDKYPKTMGLGITFEEHNSFWFMHAIAKALAIYSSKKKFEKITKHNMKVDFSWAHSAKTYLALYKK